ncbi:MAG: DeoR/GlpR family DNA-binding transcription regulator [Aquiluna sp.]|nr:DeoR/GlpR family DNA-binding transcription regulator [Aquiluna sp.]
MLAEERRLKLSEWTRVDGRLDANIAANSLDVAVETVRRDLDVLQRRGVLRRVHGGAISLDRFAHEYTIPERYGQNPSKKRRLADVAAAFIPSEGCIFVDGGTTTECLAPHLMNKPGLLVVTNNLTLAGKIADSSTQTYLLGGKIRPATLSAVGAKTCDDLRELNAGVSFIGANGFSLDAGATAFDTDEALVKKTMMTNSQERILMVDSGKFGSTYPAKFASFSGFDRIVTNIDVDDAFTDALSGTGVEVSLAQN